MSSMVYLRVESRAEIREIVEVVKFLTVGTPERDRRRQSPRFRTRLPVKIDHEDITTAQETTKYAHLCDISEGGLCFRSVQSFTPGQKIQITIETEYKFYTVWGRIVNCTPTRETNQVNVQFEFKGE